MVATIIIIVITVLFILGFIASEIVRHIKHRPSAFVEEDCSCKTINGKRLVACYHKQKKAEAKKGCCQNGKV
ncbi:MAG: hypothetical protein K5694_01605 [Bacilli bacterium]|nr:hypothetical protein [Bacilli bacterium]